MIFRNIHTIAHKLHINVVKFLFCVFVILIFDTVTAQNIYISKYIAGNITKEETHRVEIFNESDKRFSLGGWMIITRNYVLRLPEKTMLEPYRSLSLGKSTSGVVETDMVFNKLKDFLVRFPATKEEGDYVVLMDKEQNIQDAVYFSLTPKMKFLPDKGELITQTGEIIRFEVPGIWSNKWKKNDVIPDPAMVMVFINNEWQITSKRKNLFPATEYGEFQGNYVEGIVSLRWQTLFEQDCYQHQIERSIDGTRFEVIAVEKGKKTSKKTADYLFYDKNLAPNQHYYYRIKNTDKFNNVLYSRIVEIYTGDDGSLFSMDYIIGEADVAQALTMRFAAKQAQYVVVKLLNEEFREIGVLFEDEVSANAQNLIIYNQALPVGKYYIIAETAKKRFYLEVVIR